MQKYANVPSARISFPFVIGTDDYTKQLYFYIEHIMNQKPMFIDNFEAGIAFVRSNEAGKFLALFADNNFTGAINGASEETISIREVVDYVKLKTGKSPVLSQDGEKAPYNSAEDYYLNISKSQELGFSFTPLTSWIYELIDCYISQAQKSFFHHLHNLIGESP